MVSTEKLSSLSQQDLFNKNVDVAKKPRWTVNEIFDDQISPGLSRLGVDLQHVVSMNDKYIGNLFKNPFRTDQSHVDLLDQIEKDCERLGVKRTDLQDIRSELISVFEVRRELNKGEELEGGVSRGVSEMHQIPITRRITAIYRITEGHRI